jgi:hypothetical protein
MNPFDNMFDSPMKHLSSMSCLTVDPLALKPAKPFDIEALTKMVDDLAASTPQEWMLNSPQGVMFKGVDPVHMAAQATARPMMAHLPFLGVNLEITA